MSTGGASIGAQQLATGNTRPVGWWVANSLIGVEIHGLPVALVALRLGKVLLLLHLAISVGVVELDPRVHFGLVLAVEMGANLFIGGMTGGVHIDFAEVLDGGGPVVRARDGQSGEAL